MKKVLIGAVFITLVMLPAFGSQNRPHDADFKPFYADFLKAVKANDKEKIADLIAFPVKDWSIDQNHNVTTGSIKDRADFLARYNVLFTASMRTRIPRAKLEPLKYDSAYMISWREQDIECSFEFEYIDGAGYRIRSFSIGPS